MLSSTFFHWQNLTYLSLHGKGENVTLTGLQMTVAHWTLSDQNLLMPDKSLTVVRHNVWIFFKSNIISFWKKQIKVYLITNFNPWVNVTYIIARSFVMHPKRVHIYLYCFKCFSILDFSCFFLLLFFLCPATLLLCLTKMVT